MSYKPTNCPMCSAFLVKDNEKMHLIVAEMRDSQVGK